MIQRPTFLNVINAKPNKPSLLGKNFKAKSNKIKLSTFVNIFKAKPIINYLIEYCGKKDIYNMSKVNGITKELFENFIVLYRMNRSSMVQYYVENFCNYCELDNCKFKCSIDGKEKTCVNGFGGFYTITLRCGGHYKCTFEDNKLCKNMEKDLTSECDRCSQKRWFNVKLKKLVIKLTNYIKCNYFCNKCIEELFKNSSDEIEMNNLTSIGRHYFRFYI